MKKILVVSRVHTHPTTAANQWWIIANCDALKELDCEIYFLYVYEKPLIQKEEKGRLEATREYWGDRFYLYKVSLPEKVLINIRTRCHKFFRKNFIKCDDWYPMRLHKYVNRLNKEHSFDICIVQYFYLSKLLEKTNIPKKAIVTHDNFAYRDILTGLKTDANLDANESAKAMQRAPYIFAFNKEEEIFFKHLSPLSKVWTIYSIFDYHPQPLVGNHNIVFLSGSNIWNQNGFNWFLEKIFPAIIRRFPECKLLLGGAICEKFKHLSNNRNIEICGYVDDIASFYKQADVCINPTYQGTGFKTKTFEAISYDKIELAHPHSVLGIYKPDEAPIFSSEIAEEWVRELEQIWSCYDVIQERKKKNEIYIRSFRDYVMNIYRTFIND